jgi:uncharacterized membrane protein YraQ (UPF0718 family)
MKENNKKMNWVTVVARVIIGLFVAIIIGWSAWVSHSCLAGVEANACLKEQIRGIETLLTKIDHKTMKMDEKLIEIKEKVIQIEVSVNGKNK